MCDQQRLRPACAYAQTDQSLCLSLEYSMIVELLTEHCLEFLSLKGGCRGLSESTHVKMPHCWKSHALAHLASACSLSDSFFGVNEIFFFFVSGIAKCAHVLLFPCSW